MAGIAGSLCYGAATVFQQVSAKKEKSINNFNPFKLISLIRRGYYFTGLSLDTIGWIFFLIAVRSLPLFMVQSFVALSIVVGATLDHYWLKHPLIKTDKIAIILVVIGVTILSIIGKPGPASTTSTFFKVIFILLPIMIFILSSIILKLKKSRINNFIIASLSGLSFGITSIVTRIIIINQIDRNLIQFMLIISLIFYGVLGLVLLSVVLQRERVNRVNSVVLAAEVIFPSIIGIIFLGDSIKNNLSIVMALGLILVISGTIFTSFGDKKNVDKD